MLGSFQILDDGEPRRQPGRHAALLARRVPARRGRDRARQLGRHRAARHRQLRLDGRRRLPAGAADDARMPACRSTTSGSAGPGVTYQLPTQCWVGPHHSAVITGIARAGINALIELAGGKQPRGRPPGCFATTRRCRTRSAAPTRSSMPGAPTAAR